MAQMETEEFAEAVAKLIQTDPKVRQAIWDCTCGCPNLVVEY